MTESADEAVVDDRGALTRAIRSPLTWTLIGVASLAAWVYGPLFFPPSHVDLELRSEEFFFEANEAAGAPVLALAIWLFYRRSHYLDLLRGSGSPPAALIVFGLTISLYAWGIYTKAEDLQLTSVMGLLAGAVLLVGGGAGLRAFWLPIAFLAFALPISPVLIQSVMFPIQLATAEYAGFVLNLIGAPSFVQGDQILRSANSFVVIETCSGLRTVVTLTMLTVLLIDLFERRGVHAAILMILAPIVAFATNGLRVVTLVLNPHSSVQSIHNLQGIAMLLVGLTGMYFIDLAIEKILERRARASNANDRDRDEAEGGAERDYDSAARDQDSAARGQDSAAHGQDYGETLANPRGDASMAVRLAVVGGVLVVMIALAHSIAPWTYRRALDEGTDALLDRVLASWSPQPVAEDYQFRGSVRYLDDARRRIRVDGGLVDVFVGVGEEQLRRHTPLSLRIAWPGSGYARIDQSRARPGEGAPELDRILLRRGRRFVLSYSGFAHAGSLGTEVLRQALALDRSGFVRDRHILGIRIAADLGGGGEAAEAAAEARIRKVYERLAPALEDFAPTQARSLARGGGR